jgi:Mn-dependent DtxR family transcriptional regulator
MTLAQRVTGSVAETSSVAAHATPEVRALFEEWARAVEEEILAFLQEKGKAAPADIAAKLGLSEESSLFFIGKMARQGQIALGEIRAREK